MDILLPMLLSAPVWLLLAVGVIYGLMTRSAHRRVSTLASVALGGFLVLDITGTVVSLVYYNLVLPNGGSAMQSMAVRAFFLFQAVVHGALLAMAISAGGLDRRAPEEDVA